MGLLNADETSILFQLSRRQNRDHATKAWEHGLTIREAIYWVLTVIIHGELIPKCDLDLLNRVLSLEKS